MVKTDKSIVRHFCTATLLGRVTLELWSTRTMSDPDHGQPGPDLWSTRTTFLVNSDHENNFVNILIFYEKMVIFIIYSSLIMHYLKGFFSSNVDF